MHAFETDFIKLYNHEKVNPIFIDVIDGHLVVGTIQSGTTL